MASRPPLAGKLKEWEVMAADHNNGNDLVTWREFVLFKEESEKRNTDRFKAVDEAVKLALAAKKDHTALIVAVLGFLLALGGYLRGH